MKATFQTYKKEKAIKSDLIRLGFYNSSELYRMTILDMCIFQYLGREDIDVVYNEKMFKDKMLPVFRKKGSTKDEITYAEWDAVNNINAKTKSIRR